MSTNKYDFKIAPEGTTHFNPETCDVAACWVKVEGMDVYFKYHSLIKEPWHFWFFANRENRQDLIANFVEINPKESPQVSFIAGDKCEAYHEGVEEWYSVEILAQHPTNKVVYACMNLSNNTLFWSDTFRPLKTKEEIEREEAIAEMDVDLEYLGDDESLAEHLISKGWRKK